MIYFVQGQHSKLIKIGYTDRPFDQRWKALQLASAELLVLIGTAAGSLREEQRLHARFGDDKVHREWFKPSPDLMKFIHSQPKNAGRCRCGHPLRGANKFCSATCRWAKSPQQTLKPFVQTPVATPAPPVVARERVRVRYVNLRDTFRAANREARQWNTDIQRQRLRCLA